MEAIHRHWENGLKIDTTLDNNMSGAIDRVRKKKASLWIVDGGVGEGKTTLGTYLGKRIAFKLGQDFSIQNQVRQGGSDFLKGMDWCVSNNRSVIIYDEAGDFNTRASLTYFNQNMNRVFETYRALGIIVILCLPSFADIDTSLMKKKIARGLIHCYSRNNNYGNYKVYSLWRMWYLKSKFSKFTVPDEAYKHVAPNFYGRFKDLDPEDSQELETHSIKGKKDIIRKGMLQERGMLPIKTIADKTGYSLETIRRFIDKKKVKGEKYGATLYFHKEIIEQILIQKEKTGRIAL
jgi:hypothetical protein